MYYIKLKIQTIKFKRIFSNYVRNKNADFKQPNQVIVFFICISSAAQNIHEHIHSQNLQAHNQRWQHFLARELTLILLSLLNSQPTTHISRKLVALTSPARCIMHHHTIVLEMEMLKAAYCYSTPKISLKLYNGYSFSEISF